MNNGDWTLDINIVNTKDKDNCEVANWILLERLKLDQAVNLIDVIQKHTKLKKDEELNYILAIEEGSVFDNE